MSPSYLFKLQIKRLGARPTAERQSGCRTGRPADVKAAQRGRFSGRDELMASGGAPVSGALLCALLWAVAAAAADDGPGGSPLPGTFGRVYRGTVNINAERVYAFAYSSEPGQVGASPGAPATPARCGRGGGEGEGRGAGSGAAAAPLLCGSGPGSPLRAPGPVRILGPGTAVHLWASPVRPGHPGAAGREGGGVPEGTGWAGGVVHPPDWGLVSSASSSKMGLKV